MTLSITHMTRYTYDPEAAGVSLRLKLFPQSCGSQGVIDWAVTVNEKPVEVLFIDSGGDALGQWNQHRLIEEVEIIATGTVETTNTAGVLKDLRQQARPAMYLRETVLTKPSDRIRELAEEVGSGETLSRLHDLSELVHEAIDYRTGATDNTTTAAEAAAMGVGVCQDQAHVFLCAARLLDIPARYVTGYLFDPDAEMPTDQTHAWAEAHVAGLGWVGFDITNQLCPTEVYVRLCSGLDAADAAPVRGIVSGDIEEDMQTQVAVTQIMSQSQQ